MDKLQAFNYIVSQLIEWHKEVSLKANKQPDAYKKTFTKLTVLKLLFFVSAVSKDESPEDLLDIFDNFYALPYGPVEIDIYEAMNNDTIPCYKIDGNSLSIKNNSKEYQYSGDFNKDKIDKSISLLKSKNNKLVTFSASDLVTLTHKWSSWKEAYSFAMFLGKYKMEMPIEDIRKDHCKAYSL